MSKIDVSTVDDIVVATIVTRRIVSDDEVHQISREIRGLLGRSENPRILLNMERVEVMASLMVGELIMLQKAFEREDAKLRLCSLNSLVVESLKISGICELLAIDENKQVGIENLKA